MWQRLRTIIQEDAAQRAADLFEEQFPRFDEAWHGLTWLLARNPDRGLSRTIEGREYRLYVQAGDDLAGTPELWVLFSYDENEVVIYGLNAVAPPAEESF